MKIYNLSILFLLLIININSNYLRHRLFEKSMKSMDLDSNNNLLKEILENGKAKKVVYENEKKSNGNQSGNSIDVEKLDSKYDVKTLKNVLTQLV